MNNSVVIKGNKYGIVVVLDGQIPFDEIRSQIAIKFKEASKFFENATMAISFEGRNLSNEEEKEILTIIAENTELKIACVIDNDKEREQYFKKSLEEKLNDLSTQNGQFYKGTLRSGQVLECETSVVILGDVNPGAKVISTGNVVVLGALKGTVYAGVTGNDASFVVALEMNPMQIRIGDVIARSADKPKKITKPVTQIAFVEDGAIYIEPLSREVLNDIRFY